MAIFRSLSLQNSARASFYGKDVAVLVRRDGGTELRLFQVTIGEVTIRLWRGAKHELEAMFEVPVSTLLAGFEPLDHVVGYLVVNSHPSPYVLPEIEEWLSQPRESLGRDVRLMHIDGLVNYIYENHVINEFRSFLRDERLELALSRILRPTSCGAERCE